MKRFLVPSPFSAAAGIFVALAGHASAVPVTFAVDLSIQENLSRFRPETDVVEVRGSFNDWQGGTELTDSADDSLIYDTIVDIDDVSGAAVPYKFVIIDSEGTVIWEGDVGEGQSNRTFELEDGGQALPVAFFDNLAEDPGAGVDVTFQVDMAARLQTGTFNPELDVVEARGPFNAWQGGFVLEATEDGSTIFHGTTTINTTLPGDPVPYKYIINGSDWETGENRTFVLGEESQTLEPRFFDDVEPEIPIVLGTLCIVQGDDGTVIVSWESPDAILQGTSDLAAETWEDIPDSQGHLEMTFSTGIAAAAYFRLATP